MTEVMLHSSVGESFSYAQPEFEQIQPRKESDMVIRDAVDNESTLSFNDKLDSTCDKSSESTICGSNSDDSTTSGLQLTKENSNAVVSDVQDSADSTIKSETSCEDYESMATESSVINPTCSTTSCHVQDGEKVSDEIQNAASEPIKNDDVDKSRVIVQILPSDARDSSEGIHQNKSRNENQSTHSFRDDMYKLFSSKQTNFIVENQNDDNESSLHFSGNLKSISSLEEAVIKTASRTRKRGLTSFFHYGSGPKICEIKRVTHFLKGASNRTLRFLHYVLYDKVGPTKNQMEIAKTRRNILQFCGYPFDRSSAEYKKRFNILKKMPSALLYQLHKAIFGETPVQVSRNNLIQHLLGFFLDTESYEEIYHDLQREYISDDNYKKLVERALNGPILQVLLERLNEEDVKRMKTVCKTVVEADQTVDEPMKEDEKEIDNENVLDKTDNENVQDKTAEEPYALPAYILKGSGKKLKNFPGIVKNIETASEKQLNILHYILYGRTEPLKTTRRNILEFSGYNECQNEFTAEVEDILKRLDAADLFALCKILCLRAKTNSKGLRIKKIMKYLQAPFNPLRMKIKGCRPISGYRRKIHSNVSFRPRMVASEVRIPIPQWEEPENAFSDSGCRLGDLQEIRSNIECAAPSELYELNDILYVLPTDDYFIHDRILNFTQFTFNESSMHHYFRKQLLFYMAHWRVQKIARLLNIKNWDTCTHEDLAMRIINKLKDPGSSGVAAFLQRSFPKSTFSNTLPQQTFPVTTLPSNLPQPAFPETPSLVTLPQPSFSMSTLPSNLQQPLFPNTPSPQNSPEPLFPKPTSPNNPFQPPLPKASLSSSMLEPSFPKSVSPSNLSQPPFPNSTLSSDSFQLPHPKSSLLSKVSQSALPKLVSHSNIPETSFPKSVSPSNVSQSSFPKSVSPSSLSQPSFPPKSALPSNSFQPLFSKTSLPSNSFQQPHLDTSSSSNSLQPLLPEASLTNYSLQPPLSKTQLPSSSCQPLPPQASSPSCSFQPPVSKASSPNNIQPSSLPKASPGNSTENSEFPENDFQLQVSQQHMNQAITHHEESVIIHHTVSKSSVNTEMCSSSDHLYLRGDSEKSDDSSILGCAVDDSVPLSVFIHHPTVQELKQVIFSIVKEYLFDITIGELVQKVYEHYPNCNLAYRERFIKSEAIQIISQMRKQAHDILGGMQQIPFM